MCAAIICYVFFALIPIGDDYERVSATVESASECQDLLEAWASEWMKIKWGESKPKVACLKTVSV